MFKYINLLADTAKFCMNYLKTDHSGANKYCLYHTAKDLFATLFLCFAFIHMLSLFSVLFLQNVALWIIGLFISDYTLTSQQVCSLRIAFPVF